MCVPIRRTVHKEKSKSYNSNMVSSSLSCMIREVRASLFTANNALEQQSGICHCKATCCSLEAKSFQPLASEHLGTKRGGGKRENMEKNKINKKTESKRQEESQAPFLVAIHYTFPLLLASIVTVKFIRVKIITK